VENVEQTVEGMKARGITLEDYNFPGLKTMDSIATLGEATGAGFKDTECNIIGLGNVA
jgi:hypothetical protein